MSEYTSVQVKRIAQVAHEANRAYCATQGDFSQPSWGEAPAWQRESAINGVRAHLDNPAMTPEQSHNAWQAEKIATGWVWGPEKDAQLKTHPCLVAYHELPEAQRRKDALFGAIVEALRPMAAEAAPAPLDLSAAFEDKVRRGEVKVYGTFESPMDALREESQQEEFDNESSA